MIDPTPLLRAVVGRLEGDGLTVGLADATGLTAPYVVVWPLGTDPATGPPTAGGRFADSSVRWQTTAVAPSARGASELAARVAGLLAGERFAVTGATVDVTEVQALGVRPDRDVEPPVYVAPHRWAAWTTPTS